MADIYIPTLHSFAMNNCFTGSWESFRFKATPNVVMQDAKEVDFINSTICAEYWHGPFCYEKSTVEEEKTFPMTEEGRMAMKSWLEAHI